MKKIFFTILFFLQSPLSLLSLLLIRFYKIVLSPYFGNNSRFTPTCSTYTYESIKRFGFFKGGWLGFIRILKCNPWGGSGLDEVPKVKD